jgi:hemerythrin-like domain-containing protein
MDDIVKILKHEHKLIEEAIARMWPFAKGRAAKVEDLAVFEKLILKHVSKEDSEVYVPLRRLVRLPHEDEKFFLMSRQKLEDLKISVIVFFEKYKNEKNLVNSASFEADFVRLVEKIKQRVDFENNQLFPFLVKLWQ